MMDETIAPGDACELENCLSVHWMIPRPLNFSVSDANHPFVSALAQMHY